ncbi:hypothetical protein Tco_0821316 [Tanacetum coccineum]|uniref:Reverse transcriptase domain-containing protein n=1 Tax=Tanacetum coccineum TaxID=301880 RepID=A0ABQ5AF25_9ASTR
MEQCSEGEHHKKINHPHPKRNFVPTTVATKSRQVPVNAAKQNSPRAAASISTARPVNTAAPKSKVNDALPKTYSYFKAHSLVRRAFNQKSAAKTNNFNEKVKTTRVNNVTTAGPKAVVSAAVGNEEIVVKSVERISKKKTKNEAKTTKPDSEWKSKKKTKSKSKPKCRKVNPSQPRSQKSRNISLRAPPPVVEPFNLEDPFENPPPPPPPPMADNRTMAQLLEAPTEGYEDAIVVPEINANFELKHGLINLVQNKQFLPDMTKEIHMSHIRYFNKITSTMKFPNVPTVEESCVTCGGAHSYQTCPATSGNVYRDNIQEYVSQAAAANSTKETPLFNLLLIKLPPIKLQLLKFKCIMEDFHSYVKANDAVMRNMQTQGQNMQNQLNNLATSNQRLESMLGNFIKMNTASTSGTLPSNTVTNPKEDLKGITTRSGVAYKGPTIHTTSSPKVVERDTEVTKDTMHPTNNGSTEDVPPPVVPIVNHESISEPANAPVSASRPNQKASIPFPSRRNDERRREKANDQIEKFYEIFRDLSFEISFTDALMLMPKFASTLKTLIGNKEKLSEMARTPLNENCSPTS